MRLIDADEYKERISRYPNIKPIAFKELRYVKTIKAEPIKHGHWELDMRGNWACSLCGNDPYHDNMKNMNYCPKCGAKMDGAVGCATRDCAYCGTEFTNADNNY